MNQVYQLNFKTVSVVLQNSERYAHFIKNITVTYNNELSLFIAIKTNRNRGVCYESTETTRVHQPRTPGNKWRG